MQVHTVPPEPNGYRMGTQGSCYRFRTAKNTAGYATANDDTVSARMRMWMRSKRISTSSV